VTLRRHGHTTHPLRSVKERVAATLVMPTELIGANGSSIIRQDTKMVVTGCPKQIKNHSASEKTKKRR
jgi:hypothetical protein